MIHRELRIDYNHIRLHYREKNGDACIDGFVQYWKAKEKTFKELAGSRYNALTEEIEKLYDINKDVDSIDVEVLFQPIGDKYDIRYRVEKIDVEYFSLLREIYL